MNDLSTSTCFAYSGNGLLKPEIDTLDSAVSSEKDALRHYEADGANEVIFGKAGQ